MIDLHDQFIPMGRRLSALAFNCSMNGGRGGGVLLPVEIGAYGATKTWSDQGLRSNAALMAMVHIVHGRLTGEVQGQVYRYVKEVGTFWECFLVKMPLQSGGYVYYDIDDCPYEICAASHYSPHTRFIAPNNPTNSLAMILTLFEALIDFSEVLGIDAELRPIWRDIVAHLAPFPFNQAAGIFLDWDGAPLPPKQDNQMLGVIQLIYPASRVSSSSTNRTLFQTAKHTMDYLNNWVVQPGSDGDCILFQISSRLNYNQTQMYPAFVEELGPVRSPTQAPGPVGGNLLENGMTQGQNAAGAVQYVNELLVRSDEPFVRFFSGHFSSIAPSQHGLPLPLEQDLVAPTCDLTGVWYDTHNAKIFPRNQFELKKQTAGAAATWRIDQPNEWNCEVFVNQTVDPATPLVPGTPQIVGSPECGVRIADKPARDARRSFTFSWPTALQQMVPTADCENLCFVDPGAATQNKGLPYSRSNATPPTAVCGGSGGGGVGSPKVARPWLNSSFSGLRVKGAQGSEACPLANGLCTFLVGASLSARGEPGTIHVHSERGGNFTFLSPYPNQVVLVVVELGGGGGQVACKPWSPKDLFYLESHETVFIFETKPNTAYTIQAARG
jgi:hypothetical protein